MKRIWCSRSPWGRLRIGLFAAAFLMPLAACGGSGNDQPSSTPQPVAGPAANTQPQPSTSQGTSAGTLSTQGQTTAAQGSSQPYPNLNSVPQQAPATTSSADRAQIASGLVSDNQNAAYSDQPVTAQQATTPAPAPLPAPAPAPAPAATASTDTATPPPAPAPQPTSQTTVGQMVTNQPTQTATAPQPSSASTAPAMTVVEQPVTPPATTGGVTPMAPPPNPVPASTAPPQMTPLPEAAPTPGVTVDTSQLGSPLPGYTPAPGYALNSYAPGPAGSSPAYGLPAGAAPIPGQPVAVIFFADASSAISDRGQWVLHNVLLLQQQVGGHLRIVGNASLHTVTMDPDQHAAVNYKISQSRANAVARALIGMGVPEGAIAVAAQGSQAPVFYEFMPTGEAANRRVDIFLDR
jgi:outer membrane protein OmpA-like peptidoglycan-associated protein